MDKSFELTEDNFFWIMLIFSSVFGWCDNTEQIDELLDKYKQEQENN